MGLKQVFPACRVLIVVHFGACSIDFAATPAGSSQCPVQSEISNSFGSISLLRKYGKYLIESDMEFDSEYSKCRAGIVL